MTSINYNEFQPGQGVSAPALNENFTMTDSAIENLELTLNSAISSLTSTTTLKANKNGSSAEVFNVADATEDNNAVNLGQIKNSLNPIGTVIFHAGRNIPAGYLLCNGNAVSRTTYAKLFEVIGTTFGTGDGSTTFNLPNLINKYITGSDSVGAITGSVSTNSIGEHQHACPTGGYGGVTLSAGAHTHSVSISTFKLLPCIKY